MKQVKPLTVQELYDAEVLIIKLVQKETLPEISPVSSLNKLNPFVDMYGVTRVGERLKKSNLTDSAKHPAILPRYSHITNLIIRHYHEKVKHQGRGIMMDELRASGYWSVGASSAASSVISKCVPCRKLGGTFQEQRMVELPEDRLELAQPFTNCADDYFGSFIIKEGRKELKRYGVVFTCMASRAVHLEVADTLETD